MYLDSLNSEQKANLAVIDSELKKSFDNPNTRAGALAIVAKESNFKLKPELSYKGTSNERIKQIFGSRVNTLTDSQLTALKQNDKDFFERVYGSGSGQPLGNKLPGDGYLFRGRGFNGLTGRANYKFYGDKIGFDLEKNPELLNDPEIAAKALVMYFRIQAASKAAKLNLYNATSPENFKTVQDSTRAFYHANAGWGKSQSDILADPTGGLKKALSLAPEFLEFTEKKKSKIIFLIALVLIILFFFFRK